LENLKGRLLISGAGLHDASFRQTVVLIGAHDAGGAVGVVLNRPLASAVRDVIPTLAGLVPANEPLFVGGPVEPDQAVLLVEATGPGILDVPVFGSVGFLTGDVPAGARSAVRRARVFLGHAGWGPGQLEAELAADAWITEAAAADDVFAAEPRALWRRLLERKGPPFAALARIPFDPRSN
jgi:putative transcriptional regulator